MMAASNGSDAVERGVPPPQYRLPAGTAVGAVRLQVTDLERSAAYYVDVLGLTLLGRTGNSVALGSHAGDGPLVHLDSRPGIHPVVRRATLGLYHFAILLPDRAALGRFFTHVSARHAPLGMSDHLVSEALYLTDPDGLGIEVYADRPRSTWSYRGAQLQMATAPLDTRQLTAAAGGAPWTGMPAGTTMGHIHLHVGDLQGAEAFYHAALGLDKVVWNYPGALFLSAGGYHHHLGVNTWSAGAPPATDDARLLSWELVVPAREDAAAAARSLQGAGYRVAQDADRHVVTDPWGTALHIISTERSDT
jgi:catechol 2,3-dioxygenase